MVLDGPFGIASGTSNRWLTEGGVADTQHPKLGRQAIQVQTDAVEVGIRGYAYTLASGEAWALRHPAALAVSAALLLAGLTRLRTYNHRFLKQGLPLVFEEEPEPVVQTLDLSHSALDRRVRQPEGKWPETAGADETRNSKIEIRKWKLEDGNSNSEFRVSIFEVRVSDFKGLMT